MASTDMTGSLDTTDTAGVTARQGHIGQVAGVFQTAAVLDRARLGGETQPGEEPGAPPQGAAWQKPWTPAPEAAEELAKQGLTFDPQTGQVVRLAPPARPPGSGGTMLDVTEEL
jgi:hypothetical protein